MPERLKDLLLTSSSVNRLADKLRQAYPDFDKEKFLGLILHDAWESREPKRRTGHVAQTLSRGSIK